MPPTPFECCGKPLTEARKGNGSQAPSLCESCPRRYFATLAVYRKPQGIAPGTLLNIKDLVLVKGAGQ